MGGLTDTFLELVAIDSPSFGEARMRDFLIEKLRALGAEAFEDGAGAIFGGASGNVLGFFSGEGEPAVFSAHMDTVEPSRGKKAEIRDGIIKSAGGAVLGADDCSGIAVILEAVARLKAGGEKTRPLEIVFCAAEERYGLGAAAIDYAGLKSKEAYVFDLCGHIGDCANAAPTIISFKFTIHGKAAHAGFCPKDGINAIEAAAKAVARLSQGEVSPGTTRNIAVIGGGMQSNIVPETVSVTGEIRSLNDLTARRTLEETIDAFEEEARRIGAQCVRSFRVEVKAYETPEHSKTLKRFAEACEAAGVRPNTGPTMGGSDNNHFAAHGIEGIVIACSMHNVHTTGEYCFIDEMEKCVEIAMELMRPGGE
jgi:tripeptide aminopeptidase